LININLSFLFTGLTATNEPNQLVPELKQLTIEPSGMGLLSRSMGPFVTMVASRTKHFDSTARTLEDLAIISPDLKLRENHSIDLE